MNAVEYILGRNRMCASCSCDDCELKKEKCCVTNETSEQAAKAVELVEQWLKKHPENTRESRFLKEYPFAPINPCDGFPQLKPCELDRNYHGESRCFAIGCSECRRKYWTEEMEDSKRNLS